MIKIELNAQEFLVQEGISILESGLFLGLSVPRFCYHEILSVAGNCRMCLVEVANTPKPVASCALPIHNSIKVFTNSPLVKKARENILEILLVNHPLDCPICDQAGECDLQDQVKVFGSDRSRFFFNKKVIEDKSCNTFIKTIMTRCIYCTRCIRFNNEISGYEFFGAINRSSFTEISSYSSDIYKSEISGNIIDICPVGALTSQPYAFKSRPWKLKSFESIDLTDGLAGSIFVYTKDSNIFRVLPKKNKELNDGFISDKARFSFDANNNNRLVEKEKKVYVPKLSKDAAFSQSTRVFNKINYDNSCLIFDNFLDLNSLFLFKQLENIQLDLQILNEKCFKTNFYIHWLNNQLSCFNTAKITNCFLLSANIKLENAIINMKLKIKQQKNNIKVFGFACFCNETFSVEFLSFNLYQLSFILESKDLELSKLFIEEANSLFFWGENLLKRCLDFSFLFFYIKHIIQNIIFIKISKLNIEAIQFLNFNKLNSRRIKNKKMKSFFIINIEESFFIRKTLNKVKSFNIFWINSFVTDATIHEPFFSKRGNIYDRCPHKKILYKLPLKTEYEQELIFCNLEGRFQQTAKILNSVNNSILILTDILNDFFHPFNRVLNNGYNNFLVFIQKMILYPFLFKSLNEHKNFNKFLLKKFISSFKIFILKQPIKTEVEDFFLSNHRLKFSKTMQASSQLYRKHLTNYNYQTFLIQKRYFRVEKKFRKEKIIRIQLIEKKDTLRGFIRDLPPLFVILCLISIILLKYGIGEFILYWMD